MGAIYAIQAAHGGPIKIGYVEKEDGLWQRMRALQCGNPYPLVFRMVVEGTRDQEQELHREYGDLRLAGEWFQPTAAVAQRFKALVGEADRYGYIYDQGFEDGWHAGFDDGHPNDCCGEVVCDCPETPEEAKRYGLRLKRQTVQRFEALHGTSRGSGTRRLAA